MSITVNTQEMYGVLNVERNRMLTSASGSSVWPTEEEAREVLETEFGGESHLEVVKILRDYE
jgi:hypothetical protein